MYRTLTRAALAAALTTGVMLGVTAPAVADEPFDGGRTTVSGTPAAMGQTNGPVWSLEAAAGKIFAGGEFTSTRPSGAAAGTGETGDVALAAFDATTGAPIDNFFPALSEARGELVTVWSMAVSSDGSRLYVGGDFARVGDDTARRIAVFDTGSGQFLGQVGSGGQGGVDAAVEALALSPDDSTLYVAGKFTASGGVNATLTAFDLATNRPTAWTPRRSGQIQKIDPKKPLEAVRVVSLAVSADGQRVFMAGPFREVNGQPRQGFAATYAANGALVPGFRSDYLPTQYNWGTVVEADGGTVYLAGRDDSSGPERREGVQAIDDETGALDWYADCYGDTFAIQVVGSEIYVGSHAHDCRGAGGMPRNEFEPPRTELAIHALNRATGRVKPYFVQTDGGTAKTILLSRALAWDGQNLVMGGGFARLNGALQSNLSRFRRGSATPEVAARPSAARTCRNCRAVRVTVPTTFDRDDVQLRYRFFRNGSRTPFRQVQRYSVFWAQGKVTFVDRQAQRGRRVTYRLEVVDPSGRSRSSARSQPVWVPR